MALLRRGLHSRDTMLGSHSGGHQVSLVAELPVLEFRLGRGDGIFQPPGVIDIKIVCGPQVGGRLYFHMTEIEKAASDGLVIRDIIDLVQGTLIGEMAE